jgi:hypothetical protein
VFEERDPTPIVTCFLKGKNPENLRLPQQQLVNLIQLVDCSSLIELVTYRGALATLIFTCCFLCDTDPYQYVIECHAVFCISSPTLHNEVKDMFISAVQLNPQQIDADVQVIAEPQNCSFVVSRV